MRSGRDLVRLPEPEGIDRLRASASAHASLSGAQAHPQRKRSVPNVKGHELLKSIKQSGIEQFSGERVGPDFIVFAEKMRSWSYLAGISDFLEGKLSQDALPADGLEQHYL